MSDAAFRVVLGKFRDALFDEFRRAHGVGARLQVNRYRDRRRAV